MFWMKVFQNRRRFGNPAFGRFKPIFPQGNVMSHGFQFYGRRFDSIRQMNNPESTIIADPA